LTTQHGQVFSSVVSRVLTSQLNKDTRGDAVAVHAARSVWLSRTLSRDSDEADSLNLAVESS